MLSGCKKLPPCVKNLSVRGWRAGGDICAVVTSSGHGTIGLTRQGIELRLALESHATVGGVGLRPNLETNRAFQMGYNAL